ncbi:MAG: MerR family transcriptional regulator [Clostridiales bacterium]|nr:MerR family transcriptional regulator [Clostridiales bacterium]
MERYFKIGEIAKLYGIGTDSIRHYEQLGLIHPIRDTNGYRLYHIDEIWRMNVIRDLRGLGFSLEDIRQYLDNRSIDTTLALLEKELKEIDRHFASLKRLQSNVHKRISAITTARDKAIGVVEEAFFPTRFCHEIVQPFREDAQMDMLIKKLLNHIHNRLSIIGNTHIGCTMNRDSVLAGDYHQYQSVFIIDDPQEATNGTLPQGKYLTLRYHGSTRNGDQFVPKLFAYASEKNYTLTGDILELILIDIHEASNYGEHITELQALISP